MERLLLFAIPLAFIPNLALADTQTLTFSGSTSSFCNITVVGAGTLTQSSDGTSLGTSNTGGSAASFSASTNSSSAVLDLDDAVTTTSSPSGSSFTTAQNINVLNPSGASLYSGDGSTGASATLVAGTNTGTVGLTVTASSGTLPSGSYAFSKTVTCTP